DADAPDSPSPAAFSLTPRSIGLSFVGEPTVDWLVVPASWGEYEKRDRAEVELEPEEATDIDREDDADETAQKMKRKHNEWVRSHHSEDVSLGGLVEGRAKPVDVGEGVQLGWNIRTLDGNRVV